MAGFTFSNDDLVESSNYYKDRLHRQQQLQVVCQHRQQSHLVPRIHTAILSAPNKRDVHNTKDIVESPGRRNDLVYVHCATTDDDEVEDEQDDRHSVVRSRSWLCCPGERESERVVPIHVETNSSSKNNVSAVDIVVEKK